jgi:hypothetical protein
LPFPFVNIEKTDSALFSAAKDNSENPVWVKRPLGDFSKYKAVSIINYAPTNPQSGLY